MHQLSKRKLSSQTLFNTCMKASNSSNTDLNIIVGSARDFSTNLALNGSVKLIVYKQRVILFTFEKCAATINS